MFQLIRKDSGEGIVCAVGKDRVHIAPVTRSDSRPGSAQSSPSPKSCNSGGCGARSKGRGNCGGCVALVSVDDGGYVGKFHIPVKNPESFKPGDRVRFSRFIPEPNLASMLVFGVPVAFALAAVLYHVINASNAPQSAESPAAVLSVIMAFFGGFAVLGVINYFFKARYPSSIISDGAGGGNDI